MQRRGAVGRRQRAEGRGLVRGEVLRIRMACLGSVVLQQRRQPGAVGLEQLDLRQHGVAGPAVDEDAGIAREAGRVHAGRLRQAARLATGQRYGIGVGFGRTLTCSADVGQAVFFVHGEQAVHHPVAMGQLRQRRTFLGCQVQVLEAVTLRRPQEAPILQETQVVVQRHPGLRGLGHQRALLAGGQCRLDQVELLLIARLALEGQPLWVAPVHAGQVDVLLGTQVDPARLGARLRRDHAQLHQHVVVAGRWIALLDHFRAVGVDLVALLDRHRRFVDAGERDGRVVRCPPVAGVAVHFLVGDELGHAVADRVPAVAGQLHFLAVGQGDDPQVAVADEADEATLRRDLRIGGEAAAVRQFAYRVRAGLGEVVEIQLATEREQQRLAVRRPLVVDDARQRRNALALAAGLFFIAEHLVARQHHRRIHQQARLPAGDVVLPQVQPVAVAVLAAQEGHPRAVRRDLRLGQRGAGQRRAARDGFQREFFGVGGESGGEGHQGEQGKAHRISRAAGPVSPGLLHPGP